MGGLNLLNATPIFMKIGLEIHNISKYIVCFSRSMAVRSISVAGLVVFLISCGGAVIRLEDVCRGGGEVRLEGGGSLSRLV